MSAKRLAANMQLIGTLEALARDYPDLRFSQILANFGFVLTHCEPNTMAPIWADEYHLEPDALLNRVKAAVDKVQSEPSLAGDTLTPKKRKQMIDACSATVEDWDLEIMLDWAREAYENALDRMSDADLIKEYDFRVIGD